MGAGAPQAGAEYDPRSRNTGSWQAAGPAPGQGWAGSGQPPFHGQAQAGQPYPGQPYPGQAYPGQAYAGRAIQDSPTPGSPIQVQPQPGPGDPRYGVPPTGHGPGMRGTGSFGRVGDPMAGDPRSTGSFGRVGGPVIRQRDSALPDPPPGSKGVIAAIETDNVAAFARDLRVLRAKVGLDYPDMAEKSHYTMRTLASAAGGLRLPTLPVLIAYVNACGGDVADWEERWDRLVKSGKKGGAIVPAGEAGGREPGAVPGAAGAPGQAPPEARQTGEIYVITSAKDRDDRW